jgi:hypothetical protein
MAIRIVGDTSGIINAINGFSAAYHDDFFRVRELGRRYVCDREPGECGALAQALRCVLGSWGAGKREAPALQGLEAFERTRARPENHMRLVALAQAQGSALTFVGRRRQGTSVAEFERNLFESLIALAQELFIDNTNVTYPMKAVLLITGLMPAFDSQVRSGLKRAGLRGMDKTRYLLPRDSSRADGQKIAQLPFLLGECWKACTDQIYEGIRKSKRSNLGAEPGRFFDVLLFMQGGESNSVVLRSDPPIARWYSLQ